MNISLMNNKKSLEELYSELDEVGIDQFSRAVSLIMTVKSNYSHIVELEQLSEMFDNYNSNYKSDYKTSVTKANRIAGMIAETERNNAYNKVENQDFLLQNLLPKYLPQLLTHHKSTRGF